MNLHPLKQKNTLSQNKKDPSRKKTIFSPKNFPNLPFHHPPNRSNLYPFFEVLILHEIPVNVYLEKKAFGLGYI